MFSCANDVEHPEEIDMQQIFTQFYKADSARSKTSTGLGLSIAKGLTERMNGIVEAALNGTFFSVTVSFPLDTE